MSYDIKLINKNTKETIEVSTPFFMDGGTIPAYLDESWQWHQASQREAHVNITYNYSSYYYAATKGDERFAHIDCDGKTCYGIRGLYGKPPRESIPMILDMISRINHQYKNDDGTWKYGKRERKEYINATGKPLSFERVLSLALRDDPELKNIQEKTIQYEISEGDTANYWEATAANAIRPLKLMLHIATECISMDECVWDGD